VVERGPCDDPPAPDDGGAVDYEVEAGGVAAEEIPRVGAVSDVDAYGPVTCLVQGGDDLPADETPRSTDQGGALYSALPVIFAAAFRPCVTAWSMSMYA